MVHGAPRKTDIPPERSQGLRQHLELCLAMWGLDDLAGEIELRLSRRMTRTIGNANLAKNRISLAVWLFDQPQEIIDEVLCHEAAHLAAHHLYGPGLRPHGREWQNLMRRAGVCPRVRIPLPNPPKVSRARRRTYGFSRSKSGFFSKRTWFGLGSL